VRVLLGIPAILAFLALTAVPVLWLDGRAAYVAVLWSHPGFLAVVGATWTSIGYWVTRRIAEVLLLRRSGAKLRMDA